MRKKLLAKTNWFRKRAKKEDKNARTTQWRTGNKGATVGKHKELELRTVLFVEQSLNGELARRLRESLRRI